MAIGKVVLVGLGDLFHEGHIDHMKKARELGDYLIVAIKTEEQQSLKTGYWVLPLKTKIALIKEYPFVDCVTQNLGTDGTLYDTLKAFKPAILARGGDRTPDNMPQNEIDLCEELGIEIVYGIGDKLNSSSKIMERAFAQYSLMRLSKR